MDELCNVTNGQCFQGCEHSDTCNGDQYCNVQSHECHMGEIQCGESFFNAVPRVVNGIESIPHSRPWSVGVNGCRTCSGTLISPRHVLTAAHCRFSEGTRLQFGRHDCMNHLDIREWGRMQPKVQKFARHPKYDRNDNFSPDIAVLTLAEPIRFSTTILPACLPQISSDHYTNHTATAAGWGLTWGTGDQDRLREVDMTVLIIETCQNLDWVIEEEKRRNTPPGIRLVNSSNFLCAGEYEPHFNYTGVQKGDSGGALIIRDEKTKKNTIIGIANMAPMSEEAYNEEPSFFYTNVKPFVPWIEDIMEGKY